MRLAAPAARLALAAALAALLPAAPARAADAPPKADEPKGLARFTSHPRFLGAKISPKGTYLAAVVAKGGRRALVFVDVATRKPVGSFNPAGETTVGRFEWASDERVVMELLDYDGTLAGPVSRGEIYAVDATGRSGRMIFGYRTGGDNPGGTTGTHIKQAEPEYAWGRIVSTLPRDDRYVLVSSRSMLEARDLQVTLWKVDTRTGLKQRLGVGPVPECQFHADAEGTVRLASGWDEQARAHFYLKEADGWRELKEAVQLPPGGWPLAFRAKDQAVYVAAPLAGGFGVYGVPLQGGKLELVTRTELATPEDLLLDRESGRLLAVGSEPDLPGWDLLEPAHPVVKALDGLLAANPGKHVQVLDRTADDRLMVVATYSDRDPGEYLLVDVAKLSAEPLAALRPWIDPAAMGETQAFHITASDGLKIHGYLTLPPGLPAGAKPPLVVLPHGGPHGVRDDWGFDGEVQLLATAGFAVLQVNYRGSGGYGEAYQEAGYRRWGDRMIEDLLDGARWAIRKGKVDGGRVCTMGTSFGGYAAMQAAILAPDLVRCAVGIAGVYDLTLMDWTGDISWTARGRAYVKKAVGVEPAALKAASPAFNAAKLKAPVLLAHGGRDKRAPISHAEALRDALAGLGRPPEWIEEPTEGHGFFDEAARERLAGRILAFLRKHTAPPAAPPPAPAPAAAP